MGLEAECTVRAGRKTSAGMALLESDRLVFRGDFRLDLPFEGMRNVTVAGPALVIKTDDQESRFELGAQTAERWLRLITEPKGLFEKLEVTTQSKIAAVDVTDSLFLTALRERTAGLVEGRVPEGAAIIFFGAENRDSLKKIQLLRARMIDTGALWVIRPKGSKEVSEAEVFEAVHAAGLVDMKVVSFSRTHTAHKCVIPLDLRGNKVRPRPVFLSIPPSAPRIAELKKAAALAKAGKTAGGPSKSKGAAPRKAAKKKPATKAATKRR